MSSALIIGIDGALGAYLARLMRARNYAVWGTAEAPAPPHLAALGIASEVTVRRIDLSDTAAVVRLVGAAEPAEVYDLGVRGCAALSGLGVRRFALDPIARSNGDFVAVGTLHDHDSRFADPGSPAQRIVAQVAAVASGAASTIELADPGRTRDWGWTPEYVDAMWRMLQQPVAGDFEIATGTQLSEAEFARHACEYFKVDPGLVPDAPPRAAPIVDTGPALRDLGWRAYTHGRDLVHTLCEGYAATHGQA